MVRSTLRLSGCASAGDAVLTVARFLLNYTSRDAVDVLAQGLNGVAEMREAAEKHCTPADGPSPTPLFGMIHFRRRKFLVKLILEGSSRLIQGKGCFDCEECSR
jgi:hypothetical protein